MLGRQADQEEVDDEDEESYERGLGHPAVLGSTAGSGRHVSLDSGLGYSSAGSGRHVSLDSGLGYSLETSTQDLCRCESDEMIPMAHKKGKLGGKINLVVYYMTFIPPPKCFLY